MNISNIYTEVLTAINAVSKTEAAAFWHDYLYKHNATGNEIRNSSMFRGDIATILFALKADIEEELKKADSKKNGKTNFNAVKRFMKMCEKYGSEHKEYCCFAYEREGHYFATNAYCFYVSNSPDGLTFLPEGSEELYEDFGNNMYKNIVNFKTDGTTYEIPYTIAQLKAWKKAQGKNKKPFSIGYPLPKYGKQEQGYAAINVDYLIAAMEITGSNILLTNDKDHMAMENDRGDRVGIMVVYGKSPEFEKI